MIHPTFRPIIEKWKKPWIQGFFLAEKMKFQKKALPSTELYKKLLERNLTVPEEDKSAVFNAIGKIGYYRLTGYCLPFIQTMAGGKKVFIAGTTIHPILASYEFDTNLRSICLRALEKIEIALATSICNDLCIKHGPLWYIDPTVVADTKIFTDTRVQINKDLGINPKTSKPYPSNSNLFLSHYYSKYTTPVLPPAWMLRECVSFGFWSKIYRALPQIERTSISRVWAYPNKKPIEPPVFQSWLHTLSVFRNHCSHHTRITNKTFTFSPKTPDNAPAAARFSAGSDDLRTLLLLIDILLRKAAPDFEWKNLLFSEFESASLANVSISRATGFVHDWREDNFWKDWIPPAIKPPVPALPA